MSCTRKSLLLSLALGAVFVVALAPSADAQLCPLVPGFLRFDSYTAVDVDCPWAVMAAETQLRRRAVNDCFPLVPCGLQFTQTSACVSIDAGMYRVTINSRYACVISSGSGYPPPDDEPPIE